MSLKHLLMPFLSARFLSRERLMRLRAKAERARLKSGRPHELHYFHQVDDPYSALMAQVLPRLLARYGLVLVPHLVQAPTAATAPDRPRLVAYSRKDACLLARHHGLEFPECQQQPSDSAVARTAEALLSAMAQGQFAKVVGPLTAALWQVHASVNAPNDTNAPPASEALERHWAQSQALRERLGHYLGATLFYAGEWYWGLDRLYHLEQRLQDLHLQGGATGTPAPNGPLFPLDAGEKAVPLGHRAPAIDFYFSLRSPYSAIVAARVFALARNTGAQVNLRYLLPMVMRGLPVPAIKRRYIALDAAREAYVRQIPFGRINDPVGRPVERGLALMPLAEREGKGQAYVLSFLQGVWAEGLNAGSDRDLCTIAERAGLRWADAKVALADESWRHTAEANRQELLALGLWGVPSFRVGDTALWGQDRLWAVQEALAQASP